MIRSYKKARHAAPSDKMSSLKKFTAVTVVGIAAAVSVMSAASDGKTAYITDGDQTYTVAADSNDINDVLAEAGITLLSGDETFVTEQSGDSISIDVKRAFSVTITADGKESKMKLTGGTVGQALEKAGVKTTVNDFITPAADTVLAEDTEIKVARGIKLYLEKKSGSELVYVPEGTMKAALETVGCELCAEGNGKINNNTKVENGMTVYVDEVLYRTTFKNVSVEPEVVEEKCSDLPKGEKTVKQEGKSGKAETSYKEKYVNGELVEKKEDKTVVMSSPVDTIVLVGTKTEKTAAKSGKTADSSDTDTDKAESKPEKTESKVESKPEEKAESAVEETSAEADESSEPENNDGENAQETAEETGEITYSSVITGICTAYTEPGGVTATGTAPRVGTVAVNPAVIPYGTRLYIESADGSFVYGYAIAEDTGSACMAGDIVVDLYMNSEAECSDFGRRELNIYIVE